MKVKVWDPFVRCFHWTVALVFFANYWLFDDGPLHRWLGYGIAGLIALRLAWGVIGSPHARFADFFPTPSRLRAYVRALLRREHPVVLGHNPLGGLMIVALFTLLALLAATGWMMGLDPFWGADWVQDIHEILANVILVFAGIHIAAVILTDVVLEQGLFRAMITGWKTIPDSGASITRTVHPGE